MGLKQIVYFKDQKPLLRQKDAKSNLLSKVYKSLGPKEGVAVSINPMAKGYETDFASFDPEMDRVVEIYNSWGSSECTAKEGNTRPIKSSSKKGIQETESGSVIKALRSNKRFGFVAGGIDDRGVYEKFSEAGQTKYSPGLTAILAADHTRESLAAALQTRSCFATTGQRIILGLHIAGAPIGSELSTKVKPGLAINRHITGYVAGTTNLKEIALIRNGEVIKTFPTKSYFIDFAYDDMDALGKVVLPGGEGKSAFVFYYLRVTQSDGNIAWSSPIWVDYPEFQGPAPKKGKSK